MSDEKTIYVYQAPGLCVMEWADGKQENFTPKHFEDLSKQGYTFLLQKGSPPPKPNLLKISKI